MLFLGSGLDFQSNESPAIPRHQKGARHAFLVYDRGASEVTRRQIRERAARANVRVVIDEVPLTGG